MAVNGTGGRPEVSVIVPTWNQSGLVANVLHSLAEQTYRPAEILIVDNGSTDDTAEVSRRLGAHVISLSRNAGFAAAVNTGIRKAQCEWLFLLNNDVDLHPKWLEAALKAAQEADADFVTGKLLQKRAPQRLDGTWERLHSALREWLHRRGRA